MPNYNKIKFALEFATHSVSLPYHTLLNAVYADDVPNASRLFRDPDDMNELHPDQELLPTIRHIISHEMIIPFATSTADETSVIQIIDAAALFTDVGKRQRRLTTSSLTEALDTAIRHKQTLVTIRVATSHIHVDDSDGHVTFCDWSKLSTTPFPPLERTTTTPEQNMATAFANALPPVLASLQQQPTSSTPAGPPSPRSTSGLLPPITTYTFNPANLPPDVQQRYSNKTADGLIRRNIIRAPYASGFRYHLEDTDKLILADGTLYVIQPPDEKGLTKAVLNCTDTSPTGIREWYTYFTNSCHSFGYYVHPLWCFRKDTGGLRGFTAGNGTDDDLPLRMDIGLRRMKETIFRLLTKDKMFPTDSPFPASVRSCGGDGYRALKAILRTAHPAFHPMPSNLILYYPQQKNNSLEAYFKMFVDHQQLRAYISNSAETLNEDSEVNTFITNTKYSAFLHRVTQDERNLPSKAHKYTESALLDTLYAFLARADSPVHRDAAPKRGIDGPTSRNDFSHKEPYPRRYPKYPTPKYPPAPPRKFPALPPSTSGASVKRIGSVPDDPQSDPEDNFVDDLQSIAVPNDVDSQETYHRYCISVHRLSAQPRTTGPISCIVCGAEHMFDKCDVLNNTEFLRSHYIRYCQQLRRDATARASALGPNSQVPTRNQSPVHLIEAEDELPTTPQDFHQGHD